MRRADLLPGLALLTCALAALALADLLPHPLRGAVALVFITCCPGYALLKAVGAPDSGETLAFSVLGSVALAVLVNVAAALLGIWSPSATLGVLGAVCLFGIGVHFRRTHRTPQP